MTTITTQQENQLITSVSASLVRECLCTPKQALATGVVFASCINELLNNQEEWLYTMATHLDDLEVDDEKLEAYPALDALVRTGYIEFLLGTKVLIAGKKTIKILDEVRTSYAPLKAEEGIIERVRGYTQVNDSELFKEAIHALEGTEYMASTDMLNIARRVYKKATLEQQQRLMAEDYVLKGTAKMEPLAAYVSEFFGDRRGRIYQASCFGPNGQSSDMARSMMDLHGVSMDYDTEEVLKLLVAEVGDMGTWETKAFLDIDYYEALNHTEDFILTHFDDETSHVAKPWNFVKFVFLIDALQKGEKPYIGVAIGLDAKCSGPQLGALMVADQVMLAATGFTMKKMNDAYQNVVISCEAQGIKGLTRSLVKKSFMAVFYGAGKAAMFEADTIEENTWDVLYKGLSAEEAIDKSELFHKAIVNSFGRNINTIRATIKSAGFDFDMEEGKYDKPLKHRMPDGFEVSMDYKVKLDINGGVVEKSVSTSTNIKSGLINKTFENMVFTTNEVDYDKYARTGFVNMIQATDALLARLIIVHANRLGAQHIIAIHDCFRVNIHDMHILKQAIKNAYKDLFGSMKNNRTKDLPLGTDILGMYFDGSKEVTKEKYKAGCMHHSQFYKNGTRTLRAVNGIRFKELVDALGTTYYFAK